MNPALIFTVLTHNGADVKAIIDLIGLDNLFKMAPHLMAIMKTVDDAKKPS